MLEKIDKFTPIAITLCGTGEMAQSVRCLPQKHKDRNLFNPELQTKADFGSMCL